MTEQTVEPCHDQLVVQVDDGRGDATTRAGQDPCCNGVYVKPVQYHHL